MPSPNARHEICLRMALGAGRTSVLVMVIREALGMASVGTEIGLLLALAFARLLRDLLYGVRPTDHLIYARSQRPSALWPCSRVTFPPAGRRKSTQYWHSAMNEAPTWVECGLGLKASASRDRTTMKIDG